MQKSGALFLLLLFLSAPAFAVRGSHLKVPLTTRTLCRPPYLVTRTSSGSCHVSWTENSRAGPESRICIPVDLWKEWISREPFRCISVTGRWNMGNAQWLLSEREVEEDTYSFTVKKWHGFRSTSPWFSILNAIERMREGISYDLASRDPMGILRSLVISEKEGEGKVDVLRMLGFVHLANATGIHFYFILHGFVWIWLYFVRCGPIRHFLIQHPRIKLSEKGGWILGFLVCGSLWCLQGMRWGALRPLFIVFLRSLGRTLGFKWTLLTPLLICGVLECAAIVAIAKAGKSHVGQGHYFLAVAGGVLAYELTRGKKPIHQHAAMAVGSWVTCAVLSIFEENLLAPLTPLLSLLTIAPIVCVLYPVVLAHTLVDLSILLDPLLNFFHQALSFTVQLESYLGGVLRVETKWFLLSVGLAMVLNLILLAVSSCRSLQRAIRWGAVALLAVFTLGRTPKKFEEPLAVQADVGQGDAFFYGDDPRGMHALDVGSDQTSKLSQHWKAFLKEGILGLDQVSFTHLDRDHAGNLLKLAALLPIQKVSARSEHWKSERGLCLAQSLQEKGIRTSALGEEVPLGNSLLLSPSRKKNGNQFMTGFLIQIKPHLGYVNFGDADAETERRALPALKAWLDRNEIRDWVLKVSHHGSKYSSHEKLFHLPGLREAWISSGKRNLYGHPHANVLKKISMRMRRTDQEGALRLSSKMFLKPGEEIP